MIGPSGFVKKDLATIRREMEISLQQGISTDIDLSATGPFGQCNAVLSKREMDFQEALQSFYDSRNPYTATDSDLDNVLAERGLARLPASAARVDDVLLWVSGGTSVSIASGSKAKSSTAPATFSLESTVTFDGDTGGPFRGVRFALGSFSVGAVLSVTLDGVAYSHTVLTGETEAVALGSMVTAINAGSFSGAASYAQRSGTHTLQVEADSFLVSAYSAHFSEDEVAKAGVFVADNTGVQAVPALFLDTIQTPVTDWLSIEQPANGQDGRGIETDTEARIRMLQGRYQGRGTEDSIRDALYRVTGVVSAFVTSNRTDAVDGDGRDPHAVEAVVTGGTDADVASVMWGYTGAGIAFYGGTSYSVTGADGKSHTVKFSRPNPTYAWVEVSNIVVNAEETVPADQEAVIAQAISDYGNNFFGLGVNLSRGRVQASLNSLLWLADCDLRIATTPTEAGPPTYQAAPISVSGRNYCTFSTSRVAFV